MKNYKELLIWQNSVQLSIELYQLLKDCKNYSLREQMQRASVSIPSNIAEGSERASTKEFIRFLRIAKGSLAEVSTQIYISQELGILEKAKAQDLLLRYDSVSRMIQGFIKALRVRESRKDRE